ncbi:MAG: FAD-dependent oxidoreductase [Candidatus Nanohaloarchaea archaeon]
MTRELVIIGGASAAQSAAIYASRAGVDVTVVADEYGGQINNTDVVENWLGTKSISGPELAEKFTEHMRDYDVDEVTGQKAVDVRRPGDNFVVELEDGSTLEALSVVIATGGSRRKLGAEGEQEFASKGVGYCAVCDGPLYQGEEVAVIGAGYAATEAIDYLSDIAEKIYVINRSEGYSGEEITIERIKSLDNVDHLENAEVEEFYGDNLMEGLKVDHDGEMKDIEVPGAFIEIGTKPNSQISDLVERTDSMRIEVDEDMETAEEGLFAAGDVTNRGVQQLVVSAGEGCMAGLNAAEYVKEVRS